MLAGLVDGYKQFSRKLLHDVVQNVIKAGAIWITTSSEAHFTSRCCLDVLEMHKNIIKNRAAMCFTKRGNDSCL